MTSNGRQYNCGIVTSLAAIFAALGTLGFGGYAHATVTDVQVTNFKQQTIYNLQPDPAYPEIQPYSAWVGLWKLPNGMIQCDFVEATGPQSNPVIRFPVLDIANPGHGPTYVPTGWSRGMAVFAGDTPGSVTMVRPDATGLYFDEDGQFQYPSNNGQSQYPNNNMGIQRSTDGGQTWSPSVFVSRDDYQLCIPTVIKQLRDGRLVCMAGLTPSSVPEHLRMANTTKMMFISTDQGQTWGSPITIVPPSVASCEESDFVELPNGDLFWVHREDPYNSDGVWIGPQKRMQSISKKVGDTFVSQPATNCPLPASGFPCVLMTKEGVILDLGINGSHWSGDWGQTWHDLIVDGQFWYGQVINGEELHTPYYPRAIQLDDGTIVLVGHKGMDDKYGSTEQSIIMQSFRLDVVHVPEPSTSSLIGIGTLALLANWRGVSVRINKVGVSRERCLHPPEK